MGQLPLSRLSIRTSLENIEEIINLLFDNTANNWYPPNIIINKLKEINNVTEKIKA